MGTFAQRIGNPTEIIIRRTGKRNTSGSRKANKTCQELDALNQGPIVIDLQQNGEQSGTVETSETIETPAKTTHCGVASGPAGSARRD